MRKQKNQKSHRGSKKFIRWTGPALALCLSLLSAVAARAGFRQNPSVVAQSMGGSFAAKADDAGAVFLNPAGLSQLSRAEAGFLYGKPFAAMENVSLREMYFNAALPLGRRWTLGAGASSFDAAGSLTEQQGLLGLAWQAHQALSIGANVTYLSHRYNPSDGSSSADPLFAGKQAKGAAGVDAGILLKPFKHLRLGLAGRNLNRPDVGLASTDRVPLEIRGGGLVAFNRVHVSGDVLLRKAGAEVVDGNQTTWGLGVEWQALAASKNGTPGLALRGGLSGGEITAGIGLSLGSLGLHYASELIRNLADSGGGGGSGGNHRVAMTFKFGGVR